MLSVFYLSMLALAFLAFYAHLNGRLGDVLHELAAP